MYLGNKPTALPLSSNDLEDNIISTAKIQDNAVTAAKYIEPIPFRNIIINGDMSIAQRGTSETGITSSGYYTVDRFNLEIGSPGTWTQSQSTDVPAGQGFATSLKMDCTTAKASLGSGDLCHINQRFEGQNLQYLKKGTSSAESLTLSFWTKSNKTGTYIAEFRERDNNRTISQAYTISSANTWEKKTITYAGDTSGALGNDNGNSMHIGFWLAAGTTYSSGTLQTSWGSRVDANRAVGQVNLADSTANEWYITGVQLEAGTTASDFEFLPVDVNLQRCYRYFYKATETETSLTLCAGHLSGSTAIGTLPHPVTMRTAPTSTYSGDYRVYVAGSYTTKADLGISNGTRSFRTLATSVSGTSGQAMHIDYNTSAFINFSSEL